MTSINRRGVTLAAMIVAVAMTFIDQTIVSVAAPQIQANLGLSSAGLQWGVNAYLLAMATFFAFGGRLADTMGHRRMVAIGIIVFATASVLCGLTPAGQLAEGWLVSARALQGIGGALMYPAALAIVVDASGIAERGKTLAVFFGVAGGLTAIGPALGGYLTAWTWRSIFWINVPVALVALLLIARSRPANQPRRANLDLPGLVLITVGVGVSVLGLQQGPRWGWTSGLTLGAFAVAVAMLAALVAHERRTMDPLVNLAMFRDRAFAVDTLVLLSASIVFVPVFFFASEYGQISLGQTPSQASLLLLYFFAGFVVAAQFGGRMLDRIGARRPVVLGAILAAVGLNLWAGHVTSLSVGSQVTFIVMTGAGMGLLLGQANTDALNHAPRDSYGEAIGVTQTIRNLGASLGLAATGTVLVTQLHANVQESLTERGLPAGQAHLLADHIAQLSDHRLAATIPQFVRADFASATGSALTLLSWVMAATAVIAFVGLPRRAPARHMSDPLAVDETARELVVAGGS